MRGKSSFHDRELEYTLTSGVVKSSGNARLLSKVSHLIFLEAKLAVLANLLAALATQGWASNGKEKYKTLKNKLLLANHTNRKILAQLLQYPAVGRPF